MYLGLNIKKIREHWGLSQEEFGVLIKATRGMIMQYEKRGTMPKNETVSQIIRVTGFTRENLLNKEILELPEMKQEDKLLIEKYRAAETQNQGEMLKNQDTQNQSGEQYITTTASEINIGNDKDKFDQILAAHIILIKSTADYAAAALLREQNYLNLIEENKTFARMINPSIASGVPLNQLDDEEKLKYARIIRQEILKGKYPNADAVVEEWGKPGSPG